MIIAPFDLETIPKQDLPEGCEVEVKIGNLKDPEKIKKKIEEGIDKAAATDPALCQVTTFCGVFWDTEKHSIEHKVSTQWPPLEDEYSGIYEAKQFIDKACTEKVPLVSFNGAGFDLPVLRFRSIELDVPLDPVMMSRLTVTRYPIKEHYDLQLILADFNPSRWHRFDFYLRMFGIGQKTEGMDGSQVYPLWKAGRFDEIQQYCEDDVYNLCSLFERVEHWITIPS